MKISTHLSDEPYKVQGIQADGTKPSDPEHIYLLQAIPSDNEITVIGGETTYLSFVVRPWVM